MPFTPRAGVAIPVSPHRRWIATVGSVGQPRDGDPRACWVLWEHSDVEGSRLGSATWRRVPYAIRETQAAMRAVHLPERLIERLAHGE